MMGFHRRMFPSSLVNPGIGRAFAVGPDAEQRAEGVERIEAPVKAERKFIEVGLQVLRFDAPVMRPLQPRLEVRENEVNDGQVFLSDLRVASFDNRQMGIAAHAELVIGRSRVRDDNRAGLNGLFHKADQRLSGAIWNDFQPQAARVAPAAPHGLIALLSGAGANLNSGRYDSLVIGMGTFAFAAQHAADVGFVHFDVIAARQIAADPVTALADHASPQLMQDLESGFVSGEAKLALELHGRHAGRHARNEIGRPKPDRQRRMRALHHGIDREGRLLAAGAAGQNASTGRQPERLALLIAMWADEALGPLRSLKVSRARSVVFEQFLKVPQGLGERQVFPLQHVGMGRYGSIPQHGVSVPEHSFNPIKHAAGVDFALVNTIMNDSVFEIAERFAQLVKLNERVMSKPISHLYFFVSYSFSAG